MCTGFQLMLQILNLSMASKKISIPFSWLQKFLLSPLFPSKNFKTLKKSFAYSLPYLTL